MGIRTKLIKDLMSVAEAYKEGQTSGVGTMTDMGLLLDNFMKAESQKSAIPYVSASALKSAYDVCFTMKSHCGNAMAGADEDDEGYDADKEMYEKAEEFINAYEAYLR